MDLGLNMKLTQEQKLIMTQQMKLSIKILQMSSYELEKFMNNELQENPLLDSNREKNDDIGVLDYKTIAKEREKEFSNSYRYDKDNEKASPLNFISQKKTLKEFLREQIGIINIEKDIKELAHYLVESLDSRGYLVIDTKEICEELHVSNNKIEEAVNFLQTLEPDGIGARDLKECLKLQVVKKGICDEKICEIIDEFLELIAENKCVEISKKMKISVKDVQKYSDLIKTLEPKPARGFYTGEDTAYVIPDAYIRKFNGEHIIIMNDNAVPTLQINSLYKDILNKEKNEETIKYVKEKLNSAVFLIKSIEQRKSTLYKVLNEIIKNQKDYFDLGDEYLIPMTMKEVSEELKVHESTVSRAIKNKYVVTDRGTVKIKRLFTNSISSDIDVSVNNIKNLIKKIINDENKRKPFSDQKICDLLNDSNMNISRRTVAKYREEMGIKSSSKRKRF